MTLLRPQTMTLFVASIIFDGDTINLPALFELRADGWSVEIWHSGAEPDWGMDPQVFFTVRKLFPDSSPGISTDNKLMDDVAEVLSAFSEKWDAFTDGLDAFKNPKPMAWQFDPWRDGYGDEWDQNYKRS